MCPLQIFQRGEPWGREDSEDPPHPEGEDGVEDRDVTGGSGGQEGAGVRSSDAHASYFRDGQTRVDYVLVYEVKEE